MWTPGGAALAPMRSCGPVSRTVSVSVHAIHICILASLWLVLFSVEDAKLISLSYNYKPSVTLCHAICYICLTRPVSPGITYIIFSILYSLVYLISILYFLYCTPSSVCRILYIALPHLYTVFSKLHSLICILYSLYYTLSSVYRIVYIIFYCSLYWTPSSLLLRGSHLRVQLPDIWVGADYLPQEATPTQCRRLSQLCVCQRRTASDLYQAKNWWDCRVISFTASQYYSLLVSITHC